MFALGAGFSATCANSYDNIINRAEIWQPKIDLPSSVVVCRQKQCAPSKLSMSREYIYNSLLHLLDNNSQNKALLCEADPSSHICTENYLTIPITVGVTPANMYLDDVKITDISASIGNKSLNLILHYNVSYNGQTPTCKPAKTLVYVKNTDNIVMEDAGYVCKMTTIGNTIIKTLFAIDYIDLDYGYIGGYYSIGLSGPAYGGDSGYMLMRLPQDAYPLSPELILKEEPKPEVKPASPLLQMPVYLDANGNPIPFQSVPVQLDANGNPIQQVPVPVQVDANGVLMHVDINGNKIPVQLQQNIQLDANGNPIQQVPVQIQVDANGNPIQVLQPNTISNIAPANQQQEIKVEEPKEKPKKKKVKAKKASDVETKIIENTMSVEERNKLPKPKPEVEEPKPVATTYEGVKVFPLPLKKRETKSEVEVNAGSDLKDDIAQME